MIGNRPPRRIDGDSAARPFRHGRERITRARQAAEALFTPKPPVNTPSPAEPPTPNDRPSAHKPRVLGITSPPAPVPQPVIEVPLSIAPSAPHEIPRSEFGRIRAWVKCGMKAAQVAEVYGANVGDIERIIRQV